MAPTAQTASLAEFMMLGTMGPLGVSQPIYRFAAVNGAVSATVVAGLWWLTAAGVARVRRWPGPVTVFVAGLAGSGLLGAVFIAAVAAASARLPLAGALERWWPMLPIMAAPTGLLLALVGRGRPSSGAAAQD